MFQSENPIKFAFIIPVHSSHWKWKLKSRALDREIKYLDVTVVDIMFSKCFFHKGINANVKQKRVK